LGLTDAVREVSNHWQKVARTMAIKEDYHGFYDPSLRPALVQTIDDMLTEADPRRCSAEEANSDGASSPNAPLPSVLNAAWRSYLQNPDRYPGWEAEAKRLLLR
jgi:hypothetical protein